jgi:hypothetical protein
MFISRFAAVDLSQATSATELFSEIVIAAFLVSLKHAGFQSPLWRVQCSLMLQDLRYCGAEADDTGRVANHNGVRGDSPPHHGTRAHHRSSADADSVEHYDSPAKPNILFDHDIQVVQGALIGLRKITHKATVANCVVVASYDTAFGGHRGLVADVDVATHAHEFAFASNPDSVAEVDVLERELAGRHAAALATACELVRMGAPPQPMVGIYGFLQQPPGEWWLHERPAQRTAGGMKVENTHRLISIRRTFRLAVAGQLFGATES